MAPAALLSTRAVAALEAIERLGCDDLSTASEVASIVVQADRLTGREVQVARLVARGLSTNEIASTLFVSGHTVRDHLKAIFQKVGVSSRGELTSKLLAEHYGASLDHALSAAAFPTIPARREVTQWAM
jgi:DNA-binding CsgD family transcriptional regulator